jgi:hypothetical protein
MTLEILHRSLVLLCLCSRAKGAKIAPLSGARIALPRVQPIFSWFEFADHSLQDAAKRIYAASRPI